MVVGGSKKILIIYHKLSSKDVGDL